jgi:hypothetical protein
MIVRPSRVTSALTTTIASATGSAHRSARTRSWRTPARTPPSITATNSAPSISGFETISVATASAAHQPLAAAAEAACSGLARRR